MERKKERKQNTLYCYACAMIYSLDTPSVNLCWYFIKEGLITLYGGKQKLSF